MPFQRRREGVHPLRSRDEIFQRLCRRDVINAKWNDVNPLLTARSTSRLICGEASAFREKIRTIMRLDSIASMIDSPQSAPGTTSRGAIQHVTESASSRAMIASATALSFIE